ncbi:MAG: hypothetical protein HKN33_02180 [Pyrinomonadaceae bacterium]|nr:hypothetical protein [Pyrinomonadaceae bacterium]
MKTIIQTPTPDLKKSRDFYKRLGYKELSAENPTLFTDGKFIVEINPDRFTRPGLKIFTDDAKSIAEKLGELTVVIETETGFFTSDPNGIRVVLDLRPFDFESGDESFGITGGFAGVSLETTVIPQTVEFWEALGFEKGMGDISEGWAVYSNGGDIDVSIMAANTCPHLFFNPGLTFFNSGKNVENIAKLRDAEIPITEEITHFNEEGIVDNVIINDPAGLGFFIFND